MANPTVPCLHCNVIHLGGLGGGHHKHYSVEGIGYVRLLVIGNGKVEHCWRCGCVKSGWKNVKNEASEAACTDRSCLCHVSDEAM